MPEGGLSLALAVGLVKLAVYVLFIIGALGTGPLTFGVDLEPVVDGLADDCLELDLLTATRQKVFQDD